ncbi:reverse transcriptase domain-containing protein [Tanacetum coccineum]
MGNNNASSSGTLPSDTITNPRCEARAITTRSGLSYTTVPPIPPPLYDENEPLTEKETEVTKDKVLPSTKDIQPPVIQKSHDPVKPVSSPISPEPSSAQVDNSPPSNEPSKETKLPYPSRVEHEKKGENDKMLKSLLSNKEKLNEMANTPVSENCSAIILKKLPEKLGDPEQFLIPCDFSELKCKALADLGASINLMPFSVYTKLGLPALQSTRMTLELANCSLCVPKGIARDLLWSVGKLTFPVPSLLYALRIWDGMKRIVFKPDGSQDKESIHMMDIYDDQVKDVCEPKNDDSTTSTIVDEFESLLGEIIKQKEEVKGISDPVARRKACFRIINQGRVIHSPKVASINCDFPLCDDFQSFKTFSNPLFEKKDDFPSRNDESTLKEEVHKETLKSHLNPLFKDDEEIISNEASSIISPKVDVKTIVSFFAPIGNCVRKWATNEFVKVNDEVNHEVFKSDNENDLGVHDNEEEEIVFLDGLLEDENFFEINDKKGKVFDPGISHFEKDAFDDKSSKEG